MTVEVEIFEVETVVAAFDFVERYNLMIALDFKDKSGESAKAKRKNFLVGVRVSYFKFFLGIWL